MSDEAFTTQTLFRRVLDVLAKPGTIADLAPLSAHLGPTDDIPPAVFAVARTLLDAETTFAVRSDASARDRTTLQRRTAARAVALEEAAWLFLSSGAADVPMALASARRGTLEDPHLGATVVLEVARLAPGDDATEPPAGSPRYALRGPGVDGVRTLVVDAPIGWADARHEAVRDYPLGIDMLLVDRSGRIAGLPRTTVVARGDGA